METLKILISSMNEMNSCSFYWNSCYKYLLSLSLDPLTILSSVASLSVHDLDYNACKMSWHSQRPFRHGISSPRAQARWNQVRTKFDNMDLRGFSTGFILK